MSRVYERCLSPGISSILLPADAVLLDVAGRNDGYPTNAGTLVFLSADKSSPMVSVPVHVTAAGSEVQPDCSRYVGSWFAPYTGCSGGIRYYAFLGDIAPEGLVLVRPAALRGIALREGTL